MDYSPQELRDRFKKLPEEIRDIIGAEDSTQKIIGVGKKHGLHIDQEGKLGIIVGQTLFGLVKSDSFSTLVQKQLNVDLATAQAITTDINNEIFLPIRESLQKIASSEELSAVSLGSTPTVPPEHVFMNQTIPVEIPPIPPPLHQGSAGQANVFEQKMGKLFSIEKQATPPQPEPPDPYRESPA